MPFGSTIPRSFVLLALGAVIALGQSPGEIRLSAAPYTLPPLLVVAQSNNVPVTVVVRDRAGKVIRGLAQPRFHITDNGQPQ
ncbi:MAG TPA: hypothetical protein VFP94_09960, partial [Terriglobales bacterium]|nr:hypothetical protein [Terriglobales bacterium]